MNFERDIVKLRRGSFHLAHPLNLLQERSCKNKLTFHDRSLQNAMLYTVKHDDFTLVIFDKYELKKENT